MSVAKQTSAPSAPGKIDVHAHYVPDFYRRAAEAAGHLKPDGMPGFPDWNLPTTLAMMDEVQIATAVLSISSPGVHFGDDAAARDLARKVNEAGADAVSKHPARFGLFASLPLPDVAGSLREIEYALDVLQADGIVLKTNHQGIYLGDRYFDAVFAELNRRHAVVFIHPTSVHCPTCQGALPYPRSMLEFMFDTTRAITHLIFSGSLARYSQLQIIVPHAGAALPLLSDRIAGMVPILNIDNAPSSEQVLAQLRRLYYDLAGNAVPKMIDSLLATTDISHLLYGSDWPFTPAPLVRQFASMIEASKIFDARALTQIHHGNALALLPRLRSAAQAAD
jgi:6-methylsalicylate decarboxylase